MGSLPNAVLEASHGIRHPAIAGGIHEFAADEADLLRNPSDADCIVCDCAHHACHKGAVPIIVHGVPGVRAQRKIYAVNIIDDACSPCKVSAGGPGLKQSLPEFSSVGRLGRGGEVST